jgi:hypothetical protein
LGTPAGADLATDIAAIEGQTDDIGVAGAGLTAADNAVITLLGSPANVTVSADIAAIENQTDDIGVAGAGLTAADDAAISAISDIDTALFDGTSDSGDTNTLVDAALTARFATNDLLNGRYVVRSDGQACFVDDYVAASGTVEFALCVFTGAWSTQTYDVYPAGTQE